MISQTILDKFKVLYLKDYKVTLSDAEALEKCTALFNVLDVLVKPLTYPPKGGHNENR